MGELDKFTGKSVTTKPSTSVAKNSSQLPSWTQKPAAGKTSAADNILRSANARFAIALDATGSMSGLIDMAKGAVSEILKRVMSGAGRPVEIMLVAYRDYDVPNDTVVTSKPTKDANTLIAWLNTISAHGGGSNDGEAVELALEAIASEGQFDAIMLAGDEPPNSRTFITREKGKDAKIAEDFARHFAQAKTPIHTFVVGHDNRTVEAFRKIASISGGQSGKMDGSAEMIDMAVMAMLAKMKGSEGVKAYMRDYHLTSQAADFGKLLLEGPKK